MEFTEIVKGGCARFPGSVESDCRLLVFPLSRLLTGEGREGLR